MACIGSSRVALIRRHLQVLWFGLLTVCSGMVYGYMGNGLGSPAGGYNGAHGTTGVSGSEVGRMCTTGFI